MIVDLSADKSMLPISGASNVTPGLISVIVPVFNRAKMLRAAVHSVLSQTYPSVEIVIVDDGSTDDTLQVSQSIAENYPESIRVVLSRNNSGPGPARNLGLTHARGEFIQYLDSDDALESRKFELQVLALREHPEAGVAYGLTRRIDEASGTIRDWARTGDEIRDIFPSFLLQRGWDTNSPLWRRSVCEAIGPWGNFRCLEDWEHDLRAGMLGVVPVRVVQHVATVRDHQQARASGMTTGFTPELTRELFRAHRVIWHAMKARGLTDWSYLGDFSRKLFWIARMCGERGLVCEANEALELAEEMVSTRHAPLELCVFRALTRIFGWSLAVSFSEKVRGQLRRAKWEPLYGSDFRPKSHV